MAFKEIVIISGKGGTGKTTISASLIPFFSNSVIADCDVDAPDLDILLKPVVGLRESISASNKAFINGQDCLNCGKCQDICFFSAVTKSNGFYHIDPIKCEGCKVCLLVCPAGVIDIIPSHTGEIFESETDFGPMVHARLSPGEEVSGRLISLVRSRAKSKAEAQNKDLIIIDGPPGVACNVISSITGADLALLVTEPTISGFHDLKRVYDTAQKVRVPSGIIINKHGLSEKYSLLIEEFAHTQNIPLLGKIPLSNEIRQSTNRCEIASLALKENPESNYWNRLVEKIKKII